MALSAGLLLRQSQSLVMTPQLMQSIQLLQMTHFELNQFISQEIEKNPLLEFSSGDAETGRSEASEDFASPAQSDFEPGEALQEKVGSDDWYETTHTGHADRLNDELDANFSRDFTAEESVSQSFEPPEMLSQWKSLPGSSEAAADYDLDDFVAGKVSLRDRLNEQIPFSVTGIADRMIAQELLDHVDEAGYLVCDVANLCERLSAHPQDVERVLAALQMLDPPGIFARSLSECLAIQLKQKDRLDPAMDKLLRHLDLLARRDFTALKRICGVDEEDLLDMLAEIRQLNPKPGNAFDNDVSEAISPDVIVRAAADGSWQIELNPDNLPRVLVNQSYMSTVAKRSEDHAFLSECLQNANWLTRSLDQRAKTIMKVATEIVRQQDAFLVSGVNHLRPLNLKTVAEAIKMHESTVSRVTSNKYMLTPRGLFELKYFFTVSISAVEGGDAHSAEAVRNRIRTLIAQESPDAVLSDDDIVETLKKEGIDLARRTVAKYREAMGLPSSVQRRREKRAIAKASAF